MNMVNYCNSVRWDEQVATAELRIVRLIPEVPILDIVIEAEAVGGAELGQDV